MIYIPTPSLAVPEPLYIRVVLSNGKVFEIDWRDFEGAKKRDPGMRTVPGADRDELILSADDFCFLLQNKVRP